MTFAEEIEKKAGGEAIEAVVIGAFGWGEIGETDAYGEDRIARKAEVRRVEILTWEQARPMLDYEYDDGHGAPECDAVTVWTEKQVITVTEYDGATGLVSTPRHPVADPPPTMSGGG